MATTISAKTTVCQNLINGEWVPAKSGATFEDRNPANHDEVIATFPQSGVEDLEAAISAAEAAAESWRNFPAPRRGEILFRAGQLLIERKEELSRLMTREMGKILKETRGDVQEAIDTCFYYAGEGRRLWGHTTPSEMPNKFGMYVRQPVGICALITPWNFPMAIPSWKVLPALIGGNTMILKPASDTPYSALKLCEILTEAGIPKGVLNCVTGPGSKLGDAILNHPKIRLVSFTGSSDVGRRVGELGGRGLKKVSMELGGKNPQVVMDDAKLDLAIEGALWGAFGTAGQRCTATSRIIVHEKVYNEFRDRLVERAKKLKVGDGMTSEMGPVINESAREKIDEYVQIGKQEGAKMLCGGTYLTDGDLAKGWFYAPTVFADVDPDMRIAQEEIFGPVTALIKAKDLNHAIEIVNNTQYGLSCSCYTQDINRAAQFIGEAYFGLVYINAPTIGAEVHYPFGGTRNTGNGHREAAETALEIFTEWKSVFVDYSGTLQRAQIDNPE